MTSFKYKCPVLLIILFLPFSSLLFSQKKDALPFNKILPSGSISTIMQDSVGFMWFGDESGLIKYDGNKLKPFIHNPEDPYSISSNWVTCIIEMDSVNLWIGTLYGGLNRFDRNSEHFEIFKYDSTNSNGLLDNRVHALCKGSKNSLWIGTHGGLCKFQLNKGKVINMVNYSSLADELPYLTGVPILDIHQDCDGILWLGTLGAGLIRFDPTMMQTKGYQHNPNDSNSPSFNIIGEIYKDNSNNLWLGTGLWYSHAGGGLNKFNTKTEKFTCFKYNSSNPYSINNDIILDIVPDKRNTKSGLWIATYGGGLDYFDLLAEKFTHYPHDLSDVKSIPSNLVQSLFIDRSGNLWVGFKGFGVAKSSPSANKFSHLYKKPGHTSTLTSSIVMAVCQTKDNKIWIGTYGGGVNVWDRENGKFKTYALDRNNLNSLDNNFVFAIIQDNFNSEIMWIGTEDGLNRLNTKTDKFRHYKKDPDDPSSLPSHGIRCLLQDNDGSIWIGTLLSGLIHFDPQTDCFIKYLPTLASIGQAKDITINDIIHGKSGNLWLATHSKGIFKFDKTTKIFTRFQHIAGDSNSLSYNCALSLWEGEDEKLWIATHGGLNVLDRSSGRFKVYTKNDGLASNQLFGILGDDNGNLWISSANGLSCFNIENQSFQNYDEFDGLQSKLFVDYSFALGLHGELFFGGINGLNYFNPDSIYYNSYVPPIVITNFAIQQYQKNESSKQNSDLVEKKIIGNGEIRLSYKQNFFTIEFTALDYQAPEKNQFSYQLEGVENDWIMCGNRHYAFYTNINPGTYAFKVRGSNNSLKIHILPPWWRTTWAWMLWSGLFIAAIYGAYRLQLNRARLQQQMQLEHDHAQKLSQLDHVKSTFFANVSHEFRTPLTLILGPLEEIQQKSRSAWLKKQCAVMLSNGRRLLVLINQLLDFSALEAGGLKLLVSETDMQ